MKRLIRTDTSEAVTVAGPPLADGRVLVQRVDGGTLDVVNVNQLDVIEIDPDGR